MKIETRGILRILISDDDLWLYNSKSQTFSKEVYLGKSDNGNDWSEITEVEKLELEKAFENEILVDQNEATKEDLYNALAELGVE